MRATLFALASAAVAVPIHAVVYNVSTCDEFLAIDDRVATGLAITSKAVDCSTYTSFIVRNAMTVTATVPEVTLSNFSLQVLGELTIEPDVIFQIVDQEVSCLHIPRSPHELSFGVSKFGVVSSQVGLGDSTSLLNTNLNLNTVQD